MNSALKNLRIGIVFSGGFAKGAYEIGFCKALLEHTNIENIKAVSGASIGALNAYGFINNNLDYLLDIWRNLEFKSAKEFFVKSNKRKIIYDYIEQMHSNTCVNNSASCYIDYIKVPNISLCYKNINKEIGNNQKDFLKACVSVPGLYNPILVNNDYFVDGAFLDNTPITPMENEDLDVIFVLRFDHASEQYEDLKTNASIIEVVFEDDKKLKDYFYFNSSLTNKLIEQGYRKSKDILAEFNQMISDGKILYGQDNNARSYFSEMEEKMNVTHKKSKKFVVIAYVLVFLDLYCLTLYL